MRVRIPREMSTFDLTTGPNNLKSPSNYNNDSYLRHAGDDRYKIIRIYTFGLYAALFILFLSFIAHLFKRIGKIFTAHQFKLKLARSLFGLTSKEFHDTEFRDVEGAAAYIPQFHPPDLLNPILGCDMTELPIQFSPFSSNSYGEYTVDPRVSISDRFSY